MAGSYDESAHPTLLPRKLVPRVTGELQASYRRVVEEQLRLSGRDAEILDESVLARVTQRT